MKNSAFKTAASFGFFALAIILAMLILFHYFGSSLLKEEKFNPVAGGTAKTIILDAGHGGIDGGAISSDGIPEKHINLQIAKVLAELFRASGYEVVMTREEDVLLTTGDSKGNIKTKDLKARLLIAKQYPDATLVSIHCNKFPQQSCKGLQVYYSTNSPQSKVIADNIQNSVASYFQKDNHRKTKPATSSIYLMYRAGNQRFLWSAVFCQMSRKSKN